MEFYEISIHERSRLYRYRRVSRCFVNMAFMLSCCMLSIYYFMDKAVFTVCSSSDDRLTLFANLTPCPCLCFFTSTAKIKVFLFQLYFLPSSFPYR